MNPLEQLAPQVAVAIVDPEAARRTPMTAPGHLVYSAKMDQEKLECFYGWCCMMCCAKQTMGRRTVVDIYTNGMQTNVPIGVCCCCWTDNTRYMYWDDYKVKVGLSIGAAGCCRPYPFCCPHACGCCGDVLYFFRCCPCGMAASCPLGLGHTSLCGGWYCCFALCVTDLICGLKPAEAPIVEEVIKSAFSGIATPCIRAPYMPVITMK